MRYLLSLGFLLAVSTSYIAAGVTIYVIDNGVHTEIVVPIENEVMDWREFIPMEKMGLSGIQNWNYLAIGWGDRGFYMNTPEWEDLTLHVAFAALFLPTPSVIRMEGYKTIRASDFIIKVELTGEQYRNLAEFIKSSFHTNKNGKVVEVGEGQDVSATFFKARGIYFFLNTSNTWTARALRKAGIEISRITIFSWTVMEALKY